MPRDSQGTYTLPPGNPVTPGTIITSDWANVTMADIATAISDSLDRRGRGGMLTPFKFTDGNLIAPGASWVNEPTTGHWREGAGDVRMGILGNPIQRWIQQGSFLWNEGTSQWNKILTDADNTGPSPGTAEGQTLRWSEGDVDWIANNALIIDPSGNVGIGSVDPARGLNVDGAIQSKRIGQAQFFAYREAAIQASDGIGALYFRGQTPNGTAVNASNVEGRSDELWTDTSTPSYIRFSTTPSGSTTATEAMRIDSTGNVGIGTDNPAYKFVVQSNSFHPLTNVRTLAGFVSVDLVNTASGSLTRLSDSNGTFILQNGIGDQTTVPGITLGVDSSGTLTAAGDVISQTYATSGGRLALGNVSHGIRRGPDAFTSAPANINDVDVYTSGGGGGISFSTIGGEQQVRLSSDGSLGIGIANPTNKLQVNGDIRITPKSSTNRTFVMDNGAGSDRFSITNFAVDGSTVFKQAIAHMAFETNALERMRISSTGVVTGLFTGVGITQNLSKFQVVTALPGTPDANTIYFVTG